MNILIHTTYSTYVSKKAGGAETSLRLIAEKMAERGHSVTYLTRSESNIFRYHQKKIDGVNVIFFPSLSNFRYIWLPSRLYTKIDMFFNYFLLQHIIGLDNIDVVHIYYDLDAINFFLKHKGEENKYVIVMRMAGLHWYEQCLKRPSLIKIYEKVFNSVESVNFIHSDLERMVFDKFHELGMNIALKHSFVGDIGSSVSIGRKLSYRDLNNRRFKIIMATRFSNYQKRQDILVKAISLITENIPLEIKLIGDGPERDRIQHMVKDLNLEHCINFQSFTDQNALWAELESADMLCHACDYEGLSKIIIESMALGLPVLVSNVRPLNDYIEDGKNGFLVNNLPQDWAEKIVTLYHNKEARIQVSENEIEFVKERYDPQKNINIFENCFEQCIRN